MGAIRKRPHGRTPYTRSFVDRKDNTPSFSKEFLVPVEPHSQSHIEHYTIKSNTPRVPAKQFWEESVTLPGYDTLMEEVEAPVTPSTPSDDTTKDPDYVSKSCCCLFHIGLQ